MGFLRQSNTKVPSKIWRLDGGLSGAGQSMYLTRSHQRNLQHGIFSERKSLGLLETQSEPSANITQFDIGRIFSPYLVRGGVTNLGWVRSVWKGGLMGPIRCLACQRISRGGGWQGVDRSTSDPNPVCLTPIIMVQTEMTE